MEDLVNRIHNCDWLELIPKIKNDALDLVITSPPYNVNLGDNKYNKTPYDLYNDNRAHADYIRWLSSIFSALYPKMKSGGRICINIGDGKNGAVPTHSDIIQFMCSELKYIPMTTIIWEKSQCGSRTAWGSFASPSSPSFPTPFEYVLVFAKEFKKLQRQGTSKILKKKFIEWTLPLWKIAPETRMQEFGHPAMFPESLVKRLILMLSWDDSLVYDPFCGAGTTCVVAKRLERDFIGSDISEEYCKTAEERVEISEGRKFKKKIFKADKKISIVSEKSKGIWGRN